ncbi:hypothetical protein YC2023_002776 [Brassica napus]
MVNTVRENCMCGRTALVLLLHSDTKPNKAHERCRSSGSCMKDVYQADNAGEILIKANQSLSWRFISDSLLLIRYRIKWFITINSFLYSLDPIHDYYSKLLISLQGGESSPIKRPKVRKLARNLKHGGELMGLDMLLQDAKVIMF